MSNIGSRIQEAMKDRPGSAKILMVAGDLPQLIMVLLLIVFGPSTVNAIALVEDQVEKHGSNPMIPALFVFGDSIVDAGTNSFFPSLFRANFKPYGMLLGKPTGRFTNGRTYADFIASYIGLPFVEPYLKRTGKRSILKGVNYASAGAGFLRSTNADLRVVPYPDQILQFGQTKLQIEEELNSVPPAKELLSKSLYLINIGGNDLYFGYLLNQYARAPQQQFIDGLLAILSDSISVLYEAGARKLMFVTSAPLGCLPNSLVLEGVTDGKCIESFNNVVQAYNDALERFAYKLPQTFPNMTTVVGKAFSRYVEFVTSGEKYGFTTGVTACCGSGMYNGASQCGRPADLISNPPTNLCDNVAEHVFWDQLHSTDKTYGIISEGFWTGNSSFIAPVNLKTFLS